MRWLCLSNPMKAKPNPFKNVTSFPNQSLGFLLVQVQKQQQILQIIQKVLPAQLSMHVSHCVINNQKLLIYTTSANWASQIRFYNQAMLSAITSQTTYPVTGLQVKVLLDGNAYKNQPRKANLPSLGTIDIIRNHSLTVSDNQLKNSLLNLSATLKRLSQD